MGSRTIKEEILCMFNKMVFERGLKQTNLDDLAAALKISKKTIYKHFKSKDELVTDMVDCIIADIVKISGKSISEGLSPVEKYINTFVSVGNYLTGINQRLMADIQTQYPELWNKIEDIRAKRLSMFLKIIKDGADEGCFRNIDPTIAVQIITASISAVLNPAFLAGNSLSTEEAIHDLKVIILNGICNSEGIIPVK